MVCRATTRLAYPSASVQAPVSRGQCTDLPWLLIDFFVSSRLKGLLSRSTDSSRVPFTFKEVLRLFRAKPLSARPKVVSSESACGAKAEMPPLGFLLFYDRSCVKRRIQCPPASRPSLTFTCCKALRCMEGFKLQPERASANSVEAQFGPTTLAVADQQLIRSATAAAPHSDISFFPLPMACPLRCCLAAKFHLLATFLWCPAVAGRSV